jgi:hypothetical protein
MHSFSSSGNDGLRCPWRVWQADTAITVDSSRCGKKGRRLGPHESPKPFPHLERLRHTIYARALPSPPWLLPVPLSSHRCHRHHREKPRWCGGGLPRLGIWLEAPALAVSIYGGVEDGGQALAYGGDVRLWR